MRQAYTIKVLTSEEFNQIEMNVFAADYKSSKAAQLAKLLDPLDQINWSIKEET